MIEFGNKDYFVEMDEAVKTQVTLGNENQVQVCGLGTIVVVAKSD